jgi:Transposase DDE domain group 1
MKSTRHATGTNKVRRDQLGGKRGDGHARQRQEKRVRRADPRRIRVGRADPSLTGVAGLVPFGVFGKDIGLDAQLSRSFDHLKQGRGVVYPMGAQLRMLIDANVVGEQRVFGLETLAADPLFVTLAGGTVPSIDTVYRDLARAEAMDIRVMEVIMAVHGVEALRTLRTDRAHCDIDTTVEVVFGEQEGAEVGYNPRYPGRRSYHPIVAFVAETGTCVGARLRPGDTALGADDASDIATYVRRVRAHIPAETGVVTRIDSGGDCVEILGALDDIDGTTFVTKMRLTAEVIGAVMCAPTWTTTDEDADGTPLIQVAELEFRREEWTKAKRSFRVIAVRRRDRDTGKQVQLWPDLDYTVQVFVTNDRHSEPEVCAAEYDGRAEIEPRIAELKNGIGIGKIPTRDFNANQMMLLIKLLAHNLVRRYVIEHMPKLRAWRGSWLRRALFCVPGRLSRSGRRLRLHTSTRSRVHALQRAMC